MLAGADLERAHAFWLGAIFVSPRMRQIVLADGRQRILSGDTMRVLVALAAADGQRADAGATRRRCALEPRPFALACRQLARAGAAMDLRLDRIEGELRLAATPPTVPRRRYRFGYLVTHALSPRGRALPAG